MSITRDTLTATLISHRNGRVTLYDQQITAAVKTFEQFILFSKHHVIITKQPKCGNNGTMYGIFLLGEEHPINDRPMTKILATNYSSTSWRDTVKGDYLNNEKFKPLSRPYCAHSPDILKKLQDILTPTSTNILIIIDESDYGSGFDQKLHKLLIHAGIVDDGKFLDIDKMRQRNIFMVQVSATNLGPYYKLADDESTGKVVIDPTNDPLWKGCAILQNPIITTIMGPPVKFNTVDDVAEQWSQTKPTPGDGTPTNQNVTIIAAKGVQHAIICDYFKLEPDVILIQYDMNSHTQMDEIEGEIQKNNESTQPKQMIIVVKNFLNRERFLHDKFFKPFIYSMWVSYCKSYNDDVVGQFLGRLFGFYLFPTENNPIKLWAPEEAIDHYIQYATGDPNSLPPDYNSSPITRKDGVTTKLGSSFIRDLTGTTDRRVSDPTHTIPILLTVGEDGFTEEDMNTMMVKTYNKPNGVKGREGIEKRHKIFDILRRTYDGVEVDFDEIRDVIRTTKITGKNAGTDDNWRNIARKAYNKEPSGVHGIANSAPSDVNAIFYYYDAHEDDRPNKHVLITMRLALAEPFYDAPTQ